MDEKDEINLNDLFDEDKESGRKKQDGVQGERGKQAPAPFQQPENRKNPNTLSTVAAIVGSVIIAGVAFSGGMLVGKAGLDKEMKSLVNLKRAIQRYYYEEISDDEFYAVLFDAVEKGILDRYSEYLSTDELMERLQEAQGSYIGIGIAFSSNVVSADGLYIDQVSGNSPAERAGMKDGAYLVAYGEEQGQMTALTDYNAFDEFITAQLENEDFYIEYKNPGETQSVVCEISRQAYVANYVYYRAKDSAYSFTGADALTMTATEEYLAELPEKTAYIELTQFNGNADKQFKMAMDKFKAEGKEDLVLDLRGNGGGYTDILCSIASYFTKNTDDSKPLVAIADYRDGSVERFIADGNYYDEYFNENSDIYVLADENSASASECLLGAMLDYGATSYGNICLIENNGVAKTYGKGIMQSTFYLTLLGQPDAVTLTTAKIKWPKGNSIHGVGITKDNGTKVVQNNVLADDELKSALIALGV